eukprot:2397410-Rhodomonas_salina.2
MTWQFSPRLRTVRTMRISAVAGDSPRPSAPEIAGPINVMTSSSAVGLAVQFSAQSQFRSAEKVAGVSSVRSCTRWDGGSGAAMPRLSWSINGKWLMLSVSKHKLENHFLGDGQTTRVPG